MKEIKDSYENGGIVIDEKLPITDIFRLFSTSIRMRLLLAIQDMQRIPSDDTGTAGR